MLQLGFAEVKRRGRPVDILSQISAEIGGVVGIYGGFQARIQHALQRVLGEIIDHAEVVLSRYSSGLFRAIFAMKEIKYGNKIHGRVSA